MKKTLIILLILITLGAAGFWAYQTYGPPAQEPEVEYEETVAQLGTLTSMVNTTGAILPKAQTTLSFKGAGRVAQVLVQEGQAVSAGEVLAQLETTDLEYARAQAAFSVEQAKVSLASAQAQLLRAQRTTANYEIEAAEAALRSAKAAYARLLAGPSEDEIRVARANLDQAQASLEQAQAAYNQVADRPNVAMLPQSLQLEQATIAYEVAQANFELTLREPTEADIAAAQSTIAQAQSNLERLQAGIADEDLLVSQLAVQQAQLALDQARLSYEQAEENVSSAVLTAPHNGTITLVGIKEGELAGGQPAFVLTDLSEFHVDVMVDEIDIGRVAVGQPVWITLDALATATLNGTVDSIADVSQMDAGVVTFKATIQLEPTEAPLRAGMTANVDIVTEEREEILLVPNRFVRMDRTNGKTYVDRLVGQEIRATEIQLGLRDESMSEVLAGLEEGDSIVLVQESSREALQRLFMSGPPQQ